MTSRASCSERFRVEPQNMNKYTAKQQKGKKLYAVGLFLCPPKMHMLKFRSECPKFASKYQNA